MFDIRVYSIQTYEMKILHEYYCQIMTHEVCDDHHTHIIIDKLERRPPTTCRPLIPIAYYLQHL
jgi:hypothetical protein